MWPKARNVNQNSSTENIRLVNVALRFRVMDFNCWNLQEYWGRLSVVLQTYDEDFLCRKGDEQWGPGSSSTETTTAQKNPTWPKQIPGSHHSETIHWKSLLEWKDSRKKGQGWTETAVSQAVQGHCKTNYRLSTPTDRPWRVSYQVVRRGPYRAWHEERERERAYNMAQTLIF